MLRCCRGALIASTVAAAVGACPAMASAERFRGETTLGREAVVKTNARGGVTKIGIGWKMRCGRLGTFANSNITDLRDAPTGAFRTNGRYRVRSAGGREVFSIRVALTARPKLPYVWRGTFRISAVVRRSGSVVARCRMRPVRWRASIPRVEMTITSDPSDYQLRGESRTYSSLTQRFNVRSSLRSLTIETRNNSILALDNGPFALRPGRYSSTRTGGVPFLDFSFGNGRGCGRSEGEMTVLSSSFDRRRRGLRSIRLTFARRCDGSRPTLRGSLLYVR